MWPIFNPLQNVHGRRVKVPRHVIFWQDPCVFPQNCKDCLALGIDNLAHPHWISIDCAHRILTEVICGGGTGEKSLVKTPVLVSKQQICDEHTVFRKQKCYKFHWCGQKCLENRMNICCAKIENFFYLFLAVSSSAWAPMLTSVNSSYVIEKYPLFPSVVHWKVKHGERSGFCILAEVPSLVARTENLLDCQDGTFMSALFLCDGQNDCSG